MEDGLTAVTSPVWVATVSKPLPSGFLIVNSPWSPPNRPKPPNPPSPNSLPPNRPPCPKWAKGPPFGAPLPGVVALGVDGAVVCAFTAAGAARRRVACELVRAKATPSPARKNPATTETAITIRVARERRTASAPGTAIATSSCIDGPLRPRDGSVTAGAPSGGDGGEAPRDRAGCRAKLG